MSSNYSVSSDKALIQYHLDSDFSVDTAKGMFSSIRKSLDTSITYCELIAFVPTADMSHISQSEFSSIIESMKEAYERNGVVREKTAILAGSNQPLRPMANLWVGYCDLDPEISTIYRSFISLEQACEWLGVDRNYIIEFLRNSGEQQ